METDSRALGVSVFRIYRGTVYTDAGRHKDAVRRGRAGSIYPDHSLCADDHRTGGLCRSLAGTESIGHSVSKGKLKLNVEK